MPQRCQVCIHPKTQEIDERIVKGETMKKIAQDYDGLDYQNIWRHGQNHLPEKLTRAVRKREEQHAETILEGINDLLDRTKSILDDAEAKGQKTTALSAIREARSTYELLSKIAVKLEEYRREDEEKDNRKNRQYASKGLQSLSDEELKAFTQLIAKIHAQDPQYELDRETRFFVESVERIWPETNETNGKTKIDDEFRSKSPRNRARQAKNNQKGNEDDDLLLDDLDDFNLDLTDDDEIPSEESDPDWLRRERRRRR